MSRRGKNSVKSAMLRDASHAVMSSFAKPAEPKTVAVNNFNPLFHYLQTMFPNYDNAVLNSVLEQEGNSIERAIEVLLSFADAEPAKTTVVSGDDWVEDDDDDDDHTPSNVFAVPVMPPVTSQNSGRDHVVLCEYQKKKKIKANRQQRAKKRQQRAAQEQARVATPQPKKKVRWVPLQDFITETRNSFDVLRDYDDDAALLADLQSKQQSPTETDPNEDTLLSPDEIRESWEELEATLAHEEEGEEKQLEADSGDDDFVSTDEEWLPFTPAPPSFAPSSEDEAFVVIEEKLPVAEPEVCDQTAAPVVPPEVVMEQQQKQEEKKPEQVVVVKLYYSASDIHRLRFPRSAFTFAKLHTYAATYLDSKCQLLAKEALPRAFALTYVDDEGDVIHLCSEEELAEALRLHDEAFWAEGNQPIMRLHIKPLVDGALHAGHVTAGRAC